MTREIKIKSWLLVGAVIATAVLTQDTATTVVALVIAGVWGLRTWLNARADRRAATNVARSDRASGGQAR